MKASPAKAVVLLSGGIDSTTALAVSVHEGFAPYALSFRYGQRNRFELQAAVKIASAFKCHQHIILDIDLGRFGGSALTGHGDVPKGHAPLDGRIPVTYVPARNTVFLSLALAWAEAIDALDIFIGVNALDYSGYPDCRPEFISAFEKTANLATRTGVEGEKFRVHTPLIEMSKAEIIARGFSLNVDFGLTRSCYDPVDEGTACGCCESCILRKKGFLESGIADPTRYAV